MGAGFVLDGFSSALVSSMGCRFGGVRGSLAGRLSLLDQAATIPGEAILGKEVHTASQSFLLH